MNRQRLRFDNVDYSPFGTVLEERNWSAQAYRFGFQSQEEDQELWEGAVSFKYRIEDPRLGRFFSVDPLHKKFPWNSTYAFSENMVLHMIELEGLEATQPAIAPVEDEEEEIKEPQIANEWLNVDQIPFIPPLNVDFERVLHDRFEDSFKNEMIPVIQEVTDLELGPESDVVNPWELTRNISDEIRDLDYTKLLDSEGEFSNTLEITQLQVTLTNLSDTQVGPYSVNEVYEGDRRDPTKQFFITSPVEGGSYEYIDENGTKWKVEVSVKLMIMEPPV